MPAELIITKDRLAEVLKAVADLTKSTVLIGVPAENADRPPEPGEDAPPNNAVIGYINEFGDPERNIPARPHLIPAVAKAKGRMVERLRKGGREALSGDKEAGDKALHAVGLIGQNAVRAEITDGGHAPLSPVTLARRQAKGRTGEKPLIDTAQYRRAHTYAVRKRGQ